MFPVGLCDILEIRISGRERQGISFRQSGIPLEDGSPVNLCIRAYDSLSGRTNLPPVDIHLHKQIPVGAGLGGGSSNAGVTLKHLNQLADPPLPAAALGHLAASLGSDCPFFLQKEPKMMEGRGEILSPVELHPGSRHLVLIFPGIHVSTASAYAGILPGIPQTHLRDLVSLPADEWKGRVVNDFEATVFATHPELKTIKQELYGSGAVYASLSGSGSAIYGIFHSPPELSSSLSNMVVWQGEVRF